MKIRFETALVCEDVKREENGKLGLVGLFSTDIVVDRLPAVVVLSFLLVADVTAPIESEVDIRLRLDDLYLFQGKGKMAPKHRGRTLLPIGKQLLKIEKPGVLKLEVKQHRADWQTMVTAPIRSRTEASPAQSPRSQKVERPAAPVSFKSVSRANKPPRQLH